MGRTYQFRALAFGLSPAPYVFTRVVKTVVKHCRRQGMRLHAYLDDWLQPSTSKSLSIQHRDLLLRAVLSLGFVLANVLFPGCSIRSGEGMIRPSLDRIVRLQTIIQKMLASHSASAWEVHSLLGQMESVARLLPYGRAHKRLLKWHVRDRWSQATRFWDISLGPWFRQAVEQWLNKDFLHAIVPLVHPQPDFYLFTDASLVGWGDLSVSGQWSVQWSKEQWNLFGTPSSEVLSSGNFRLSGVAVDRQHNRGGLFEQSGGGGRAVGAGQVSNLVVHGNQAASVVCEATGVSDSQIRSRQTEHTRRFALEEGADHLYRVDSPQGHSQVFHFWEVPHIDLFATRLNNQLPTFVSPFHNPLAWAVDSMSLSLAYAFPPIPLLLKVLQKTEKDTCLVILIALFWESHPCFPVVSAGCSSD